MMKNTFLLKWTAANALGLGVAFVVYLQIPMLAKYGLDFEAYWQWQEQAVAHGLVSYAGMLLALLVAGAILGASQALVLRSHSLRVFSWILATTLGFALLAAVFWPLMAAEVLGIIPGPVEPITFLVGGGSLAGILQYLALRRQGIHALPGIGLWIAGLVASLVPTALLFMSLEGLGVSISWPIETFLSGFMVAGLAAWISGKALFAAISERPGPGHGNEGAV
jgi:hypothetical protein